MGELVGIAGQRMVLQSAASSKGQLIPAVWRSAARTSFDEGLFGLAHLYAHWYLARALPAERYGAFALAMLLGFLAATLHHAFVVEPLLVAGATELGRSEGYPGAILRIHLRLAVPAALLLSLLGGAAAVLGFAGELVAAGVLFLGVASVRLLRGLAFSVWPAAVGSVVVTGYAAFVMVGLVTLDQLGWLTARSALWLLGSAGTAASALVCLARRPPPASVEQVREVLGYHLAQGRFLLPLAPLRWGVDSLPLAILGALGKLEAVALLRAALNLVAPAVQLVGALRLMLLPRFARAARRGGLVRVLVRSELVTVAAGVLLFLLVTVQRERLVQVYGGRYAEAVNLLPWLSLTPMLIGCALLFGNVLRALERPALSLRAFALATVVSLAVSAWLAPRYAAQGAALALLAGYVTLLLSKGTFAIALLLRAPPGGQHETEGEPASAAARQPRDAR